MLSAKNGVYRIFTYPISNLYVEPPGYDRFGEILVGRFNPALAFKEKQGFIIRKNGIYTLNSIEGEEMLIYSGNVNAFIPIDIDREYELNLALGSFDRRVILQDRDGIYNISESFAARINSLAIFDFEKDNHCEILVGLENGELIILDGTNLDIIEKIKCSEYPLCGVNIGDINNDDINEILVLDQNEELFVIYGSTNVVPYKFIKPITGNNTMAIGDIDGDEQDDIVIAVGDDLFIWREREKITHIVVSDISEDGQGRAK